MRILSEPGSVEIDPGLIGRRLAQTAAWCTPRGHVDDPGGSLRQLPRPSRHATDSALSRDPAAVVSALMNLRAQRVVTSREVRTFGRLLAYLPEENLADGAAEEITNGFYDIEAAPPWDTWFGLFRGAISSPSYTFEAALVLLAFIPDQLVALADRGLQVVMAEELFWLEASQRSLFGLGPPAETFRAT